MNTDIFCPNCQGYVTKVNPDANGYKTTVKICSNCHTGLIIEYGNGRLSVQKN